MAIFSGLLDAFSSEFGIDLGTANTLVYVQGQGVVLNEPSIISVGYRDGKPHTLAVGKDAKQMIGRTPDSIRAIRPMRNGVIADFEMAGMMLEHFIRRVHRNRSFISPRIAVCIPSGATQVERRAIRESAESTGARDVVLIEEPMAAALGADMPIMESNASMVVEIGGGTTEVGIISLGGLATTRSVQLGGDKLDQALITYVRNNFQLQLGEQSAENLKKDIGSVCLPEDGTDGQTCTVRGMDLTTGLPREIEVSERHMYEAYSETVDQIAETVRDALRHTSPELAADLVNQGVLLTGGGALLKGIDKVIRDTTGLPVAVHDEPLFCVAYGTGKLLGNRLLLRQLAQIGSS